MNLMPSVSGIESSRNFWQGTRCWFLPNSIMGSHLLLSWWWGRRWSLKSRSVHWGRGLHQRWDRGSSVHNTPLTDYQQMQLAMPTKDYQFLCWPQCDQHSWEAPIFCLVRLIKRISLLLLPLFREFWSVVYEATNIVVLQHGQLARLWFWLDYHAIFNVVMYHRGNKQDFHLIKLIRNALLFKQCKLHLSFYSGSSLTSNKLTDLFAFQIGLCNSLLKLVVSHNLVLVREQSKVICVSFCIYTASSSMAISILQSNN